MSSETCFCPSIDRAEYEELRILYAALINTERYNRILLGFINTLHFYIRVSGVWVLKLSIFITGYKKESQSVQMFVLVKSNNIICTMKQVQLLHKKFIMQYLCFTSPGKTTKLCHLNWARDKTLLVFFLCS